MRSSDGRFYRPELDVVRFLAFSLVFLRHTTPEEPGKYAFLTHSALLQKVFAAINVAGNYGMCLFFLLSAYLIGTLLLRERRATGAVSLLAFYKRRILRIWPLYLAVLGIVFFCSFFQHSDIRGSLVYFVLLAANWFPLSQAVEDAGIGHLWSISVEEQFYMLFPAVVKTGPRGVLIFSLGLLAAAYATFVVLFALVHDAGSLTHGLWYNSLVQFGLFGAGALLALCHQDGLPGHGRGFRCLLFAGGMALFFSASYWFHFRAASPAPTLIGTVCGYTLIVAGCVCLLESVLGTTSTMPRPLIYLGKITYGLYVFQMWGLRFGSWLVAKVHHVAQTELSGTRLVEKDLVGLATTVLLAAVSYRYLEKPFLRLKRRFELVPSRPA